MAAELRWQLRPGRDATRALERKRRALRWDHAMARARKRDAEACETAIMIALVAWIIVPGIGLLAAFFLWRHAVPAEGGQWGVFFGELLKAIRGAFEDGWKITTANMNEAESILAAAFGVLMAAAAASPLLLWVCAPFFGFFGLAEGWREWPRSLEALSLDEESERAQEILERSAERADLWSACRSSRSGGSDAGKQKRKPKRL
jgi:hypothetical protein